MYSIYPALTGSSFDQGINYMKVCYDSLILGVECKDNGYSNRYFGHVLFDKINYNYIDSVSPSQASIILNLGLLHSDLVQYTGNQLVDISFDQAGKKVSVFTLSGLDNSFVPFVYSYDINDHSLKLVYPDNNELSQWQNVSLGSLTGCHPPVISVSDTTTDLVVNTVTQDERIINILTFDTVNNLCLTDYCKYTLPLDNDLTIVRVQRVGSELNFFGYTSTKDIIPFKITDK
jgi:hypothetical protein